MLSNSMADGGFKFNFGRAVKDDTQQAAALQQTSSVAAEEVFPNVQVHCLQHGLLSNSAVARIVC